MILPLLLAAPWVAILAFLLFRVRLPEELPEGGVTWSPSVSVVVPARDEALNIGTCIGSLSALDYPEYEVIVVDDRSEDGTGDLVRSMDPGRAGRLAVIDGAELPEGWLGKPWACHQGAEVASGELLLFTDADTIHGPELLSRAVAALEEDGADVLTLTGRQLMGSFWERLVQPQIFLAMLFRFHDLERAMRRKSWRGVIANGQYMLFRREAYASLGGHGAVRGEVVEDLALAQRIVREGRRLSVRLAETAFATRMYRSLSGLVEGWSKNIVMGGLQTMPPALRPFVAPVSALIGAALWIVPPATLGMALAGVGGASLLTWSGAVVALSVVLWGVFTARMGAPPWYGVLYPLGASVAMYIFLRSWARGRRVEWKGRRYVLRRPSEAP